MKPIRTIILAALLTFGLLTFSSCAKNGAPSEAPSVSASQAADKMCIRDRCHRQWTALKAYANGKGVRILGDMPIYVSADSADAWAGGEMFETDAEGNFTRVAGCPPDYFSADGQDVYKRQEHHLQAPAQESIDKKVPQKLVRRKRHGTHAPFHASHYSTKRGVVVYWIGKGLSLIHISCPQRIVSA